MSESDILRAICDYLEIKHYFFWRANNTPVFDAKRGQFRAFPKYAIKGLPDIQIITDGGFSVFLEVKQKGKYQSKDQKEFEKRCKEVGAEYHVVRSLDDMKEIGL